MSPKLTRITFGCLAAALSAICVAAEHHPAIAPDQAMQRLMDGNKRYVEGAMIHDHQSEDWRTEVAKGQHPFAIIVGCADSRVGPEVVFDQGLGDLFVIRTAGHVISPEVLGSVEYAAEHLGVSLVVVLGHARCGAVDAAIKTTHAPGNVNSLVQSIRPAVEEVKAAKGDAVHNAVCANARLQAKRIMTSQPLLAEMVKAGKLKVVSARYDLDSGRVELLP